VLIPEDDFPLHQSTEPLSHVMGGHPNAYDRFWFNGYDESLFFALALGLYPNRGVIDAAFSVCDATSQHSVFASDALVGRPTSVGPIRIEIVEPLRVNRIIVDAPAQGLHAQLEYRQRSITHEEPRQTMHDGPRLFMDVTRATQLGTWSGWIESPLGRRDIDSSFVGTKDRSWGVRPVGEPLPGAPSTRVPQLCFMWAPLNFEDRGVHFMTFDDEHGHALSRTAAVLAFEHEGVAQRQASSLEVQLLKGTRWLERATLHLGDEDIALEPVLRFAMRGAGYSHPQFAHGLWHGGPVQHGESLDLSTLAPLEFANLHTQHVVRATSPQGTGLGVLEVLIVGPYEPAGLSGLMDGAP
jgi:hypothetical protein